MKKQKTLRTVEKKMAKLKTNEMKKKEKQKKL